MTTTRTRKAPAAPAKSSAREADLVSRAEAATLVGVHQNTLRLWEAEADPATGEPLLTKVPLAQGPRRSLVYYRRAQLLDVARRKAAARSTTTVAVPAKALWDRLEEATRALGDAIEARAKAETEAAVARAEAEGAERRAQLAEERLRELLRAAGRRRGGGGRT